MARQNVLRPAQRLVGLARSQTLLVLLMLSGASASPASKPTDAAASSADAQRCSALASKGGFPVAQTKITLTKFVPAGTAMSPTGKAFPAHCVVQGVIEERVGADGHPYGTRFEVRLPAPGSWNRRFLFQGGGGTEGSLPPAIGYLPGGKAALENGFVVAAQNGGHEANGLLQNDPARAPTWAFALDKKGLTDFAYHSLDVTARTAKWLIEAYYGDPADRSYFQGCSMGGRQGLVFANRFPTYFDGIIAGEPAFNMQAYTLSATFIAQQLRRISPIGQDGQPDFSSAFSIADRRLFTRAMLETCDRLDGTRDGVIDDLKACNARFDPATFRFAAGGAPLQCRGKKSDSCLSRAQIRVIKGIHGGPRFANGRRVTAPLLNEPAPGIYYDSGFMADGTGIPSFFLGSSPIPGAGKVSMMTGKSSMAQFLTYVFFRKPEPDAEPLNFSFEKDMSKLNDGTVFQTFADRYDAASFKARGGKLILYGGQSSPGPTLESLFANYERLGAGRESFSRLFSVPGMGHCLGGPATDQFDLLTPLVQWVERGIAPDRIVASGNRFLEAPTTRSRPLCAWPKIAKIKQGKRASLADADSYSCESPAPN